MRVQCYRRRFRKLKVRSFDQVPRARGIATLSGAAELQGSVINSACELISTANFPHQATRVVQSRKAPNTQREPLVLIL